MKKGDFVTYAKILSKLAEVKPHNLIKVFAIVRFDSLSGVRMSSHLNLHCL